MLDATIRDKVVLECRLEHFRREPPTTNALERPPASPSRDFSCD
jgi:hypothetical protein